MEKCQKPHSLQIIIENEQLKTEHKRLLKYLCSVLSEATTTDDEETYFNNTTEAFKLVAAMIKQAHFPKINTEHQIPYADQALELALDSLLDDLSNKKSLIFDN